MKGESVVVPASLDAVEADGGSFASSCCGLVSAAFGMDELSVGGWLGGLSGVVASMLDGRVLVTSAIVEPIDGEPGWRTHGYGFGGMRASSVTEALSAEAEAGFPTDDVATITGQRRLDAGALCATRRGLIDDTAWAQSRYAAFRGRIGLWEFARVLIPFEELGERRLMLVQTDCLETGQAPCDRSVWLLASVAPSLVAAYRHRFAELFEHRRRLLDRLTETQRKIAALLVEGLSEPQVAKRIDRSAHTVHDHTKTIYQVWGVKSRLQLRDVWFGRENLAGAGIGAERAAE